MFIMNLLTSFPTVLSLLALVGKIPSKKASLN